MSANAHRREAARDRAAAAEHLRKYNPSAEGTAQRGMPNDPNNDLVMSDVAADYNPTQWHLSAAAKAKAHAAAHERAAAELEHFEDAACRPFSPAVRAACPFVGPVRAIEQLDNGVRIELAPGAPVATVAAHMRCHLAFARARGFEIPECPLTIRAPDIRVSGDGIAVEITTRDRNAASELQRRASALVAPESSHER
jgi:hypothetical protein